MGKEMTWLEGIIYGLISGLSEFLPISSQAHQSLLLMMFGLDGREPIRDLLVHLALLASFFTACRTLLSKLRRDNALARRVRASRNAAAYSGIYDLRLVRTAALPMLAGLLIYAAVAKIESNGVLLALFLILNGFILYLPDRFPQGNKDARSMFALESILIGVCGALSAFPGVSRISAVSAVSVMRGADRGSALNWSLLLSIPALAIFACFDVLGIINAGAAAVTFPIVAGYLLSAAAAYIGGYLGILAVRSIVSRTGITGFAYYSWGAALLSFVIYLIT